MIYTLPISQIAYVINIIIGKKWSRGQVGDGAAKGSICDFCFFKTWTTGRKLTVKEEIFQNIHHTRHTIIISYFRYCTLQCVMLHTYTLL
jgi:hypothetical protein